VRQHFGVQLRRAVPEGWKEGHRRLYEYLRNKAEPFPDTVEKMTPLYAAVVHGCMAGKATEALEETYWQRIQRAEKHFNMRNLCAFGAEAGMLASLFDPPWDRPLTELPPRVKAIVVNRAGFALWALGRTTEATTLLGTGLEANLSHGDMEDACIAATNLSDLLMFCGRLADAATVARRAIEIAIAENNQFHLVRSTALLAATLHSSGQKREAASLFQEAERLQKKRQPGHTLLYSVSGFMFCELLLECDREEDGLARAAIILKWAHGHDVPIDTAIAHLTMGRAHLLIEQRRPNGHLPPASSHLRQAVDHLRRANTQQHIPLGLLARAALYTHTHDFDLARRDLDEAHRIATRCGFRLHEADAHLGYARLTLAEGHPAAALDHLAKARAIIPATGYHRRDLELADLTAKAEEISRQERQEEYLAPLRSSRPLAPLRQTPISTPASPPPPRPPAPSLAMPSTPSRSPQVKVPVDFLIFAPLEEERDAILSKLPGHYRLDADGTDVQVYFEAKIATNRQDDAVYRILVTSPVDMGPIHAAVTAASVAARWQPEHVLVVGIAGGLTDEVSLGDIMVARSVADYTIGKVKEDGSREERWEQHAADAGLLNWANTFRTGWEDLIAVARPEGTGDPARHAGVIASGGDVIVYKNLIATYRKDMPKLIGVEMEGGGVATALHTNKLRPRFLMIRGVSDLADAEGNATTKKLWRPYARDVAAAYAIGFLRAGPVPAALRSATSGVPNPP
jgi:nucleoside phosphorylase/tetratricopeptide (TPR) repeat protein